MQCCRKTKTFINVILVGFCLILASQSYAGNASHLLIKHAVLTERQGVFVLDTQVDVAFSDGIKEALLKGFTLEYLLEFQLSLPIKYWFNDEIVTITETIKLSYHPLSRQYLVVQGGVSRSFPSLDAVAKAFETLQPIHVFERSDLEAGEPYEAVVLVRLNYKELPNTLQQQATDSESWQMTSQRFEWKPELFK